MRRVMPDLIRRRAVGRADPGGDPGSQYAVKWKKAYYGLPKRGWVIELVAYDVSVNVVFLGGAKLETPPPLGERAGPLHQGEEPGRGEGAGHAQMGQAGRACPGLDLTPGPASDAVRSVEPGDVGRVEPLGVGGRLRPTVG